MQIHELGPSPEYPNPVWIQELARFWRSATESDRLAMRLALKMKDRERVLDLLRPYTDSAIAEARKKKKNTKKKRSRRRFQWGVYGGWFYPGYHNSTGTQETGDAGDAGGGGESIQESQVTRDLLEQFVADCCQQLDIQQVPRVRLRRDPAWSQRNGTFGMFNHDTGVIDISVAQRHPVDILRTLAHELVHYRQDEIEPLPRDAGETGSVYEDEANALAGRIMRAWARRHPETFRALKESSGYIPTAAERNDPRFSMSLTQDVRPGETGRQANKLALKTDSQGRPGLLMKKLNNLLEEIKLDEKCWTGYRQSGMKKKGDRTVPNCVPVEENTELVEVDMSPGALKRWAQSDAAQRVRVGFEFEMYFPNTSSDRDDSYDELYDFNADERANSIDDVIEFFGGGNNPNGGALLRRVERQMREQYMEWRQEAIDEEMTESGFFEFMDEMDATEDIRTDKQTEFRLEAEEKLGDEAGRDEISDLAQELWQDWVETQWNRGDSVYMEQYRDYVSEALEENFSEEYWLQSEYRYMSDVSNEWDLEWPYINENYREGGQDPDAWADQLSSVIGMPVKSGGYHGTRRGEDHANLEYDSSLDDPEESEDAGLELITPYRPLPEALQILDRVIEFANRNGIYTNRSTGLHMNVSLEDVKNVDWVKLVMFMGDTYILDTFERRANTYARSSMDKLMDKVREKRAEQVQEQDADRAIYGGELDIERAMGLMRGNMIELAKQAVQAGLGSNKYQSVHVKELGNGGSYIEFRGPGGDWLGKQDENADVLRNTVFRLGRAMEIAADPEAERREYAKKLYKTLTPEMPQLRSAMQLFAQYSAGDIGREQLKREWAEAVLQAERAAVAKSRDREAVYKIVDNTTGEVLDRYEAGSDGEALEYAMSNWAGRGLNYDIKREVNRDKEFTAKERRRQDLARRVAGEPTWWRVSVTGKPQYTGWIQAPTRAKAIQDYERRTGIEGTYDRKSFDARVEEPAPLRDPGAAPNTIRGRTFYHNGDFRRDANWALVDANGAVRIAFLTPDQQAAEDRLRSWQSEQPDEERWLVSLQPRPDIRASDPEWQVTWVNNSGASMTMPVRAANEQQAIDIVKMNTPGAAMGQDIRARRTDSEDQAQRTTTTSLNQPGEGESDWEVTWDEYRERDGERIRFSDAVRVVATSAQEAATRLMRSLEAQGRNPFNINAEPTDPPAWRRNIASAGEPIPGSTLDIQRQRQQATQQRPLEFTGRWLVRSTVTGETVHTISGIGNVQADANRHAARWAQSTGFDDGIEVVPEMG